MRNTFIAVASVLAFASPAVLAQSTTAAADAKAARDTAAGAPGATAPSGASAAGRSGTMTPPTADAAAARGGTPSSARANHLLGQNLEDANGSGLGKVEELLIDPVTGRVLQVVVAVGGVLGVGDKSVALPWNRMRLEYDMGLPGTSQPPSLAGANPRVGATTGEPQAGAAGDRAGQEPADASGAPAPGPLTTPARRAGVRSADLRLVTDLTKEELEAAPEYRYEDEESGDSKRAGAAARQ